MNKYLKLSLLFLLVIWLNFVSISTVKATSSWEVCSNGQEVVYCETYDCPAGDTNKDGRCTSSDTGSRITDTRNDALCANPTSGCGEVRYYPKRSSTACLVRQETSNYSCDLSPSPTPTITPSPTPKPSSSPKAIVEGTKTTKGGQKLPETGSEFWYGLIILLGGVSGVYLYDKFKYL